MSYPTHLICRNGHFYYKIKVPSDLRLYFPSPFIKKSLKTSDLKSAKTMLVTLEFQVQRVFTILRTGMLDDGMVAAMVNGVIPVRGKSAEPIADITLSKVIRQYMTQKEPHWTPKTKMEMQGVFRLLLDIVGDVVVAGITKQDMIDLRAKLMRLPPNLYKKHPDQTISQILNTPDIQPMSIKCVNKHVGGMSALLGYCADEGVVSVNCAAGLKVSGKVRADEERHAYTLGDLRKIIKYLPQDKEAPERYWIPLLGCYTGMRLNEICQLYVEDVQEVEGVWCLSINGNYDKRLKNTTSERVIPIHPKLIALGFIDHWTGIKQAGHPRLWMNLTWMDVNGYSNGFGKWYQRFNRSYVTTDPKLVFHSFRHLVTDTLKQAGVQDSLIAELVGHSHGSHAMTMGRYGKRYQPKVLLEALVKLDYGIEIEKWSP